MPRLFLSGLALWALAFPDISMAGLAKVGLELGRGNNPYALAVARMVGSFVEYTNWPRGGQVVNLCVVGPADHAGKLESGVLGDGRRMNIHRLPATALPQGECDALYLGTMPMEDMRSITAAVRNKGVLTIAETDPQCRSNAMFCLLYRQKSLSFQMNIDAISRSGLKVDPRVLRLASGET